MSEPANPLLLNWLKELYDAANDRGSKGVTTYKRAYESMKACPLTFNHPSEAQQLNNIGPKLCNILTKKLEEHCEANGLRMPVKGKRKRQSGTGDGAFDLDDDVTHEPVKKPRKKKPYIPALRSGPYALILALSSLPEDSLDSLSKADLQVLAQPDCDSSFTVPSEANKFYTAWSSMKTLVEKDLVQERGRPTRKYNLSDEGWEVARRIKAVQAGKAIGAVTDKAPQATSKENPERPPATSMRLETTSDFPDFEDNSEWETGPHLGARHIESRPAFQGHTTLSTQKEGSQFRADSGFIDLLSSPEPAASKPRSMGMHDKQPAYQIATSLNPLNLASKKLTMKEPAHPSQQTTPTFFTPQTSGLPAFNAITLAPGTFTVQLILDTREVRTTSDRDYIHDELAKRGVKSTLRALELGDFFWIAKLNDPSILAGYGEGVGENPGELALDWIVERKRLDDLVGSIKDGRLNEQKFRLKKSGVRNVTYLIEEFTIGTQKETFHEAIQSITAATQVVDGFFVKKTQKLDDTIRYIARLTCMLKELYETKPLHLIPSNVIDGDNYLPLLQELRTQPVHRDRSYHLTYPTFASVVSKSDNLTLRDVFIRMLMCTRGVSADKALAMQKIWSTPRALIEAYEACATEKERINLVADKMVGAVGRAQIKRALSEKVASIWGTVA